MPHINALGFSGVEMEEVKEEVWGVEEKDEDERGERRLSGWYFLYCCCRFRVSRFAFFRTNLRKDPVILLSKFAYNVLNLCGYDDAFCVEYHCFKNS